MRRPPRFIAELIALAAPDGRALADLAREIGVDPTTLMQYRSGRRPLSMRAFANIVRRFGDQRVVRDLALHYATVEYHVEEGAAVGAAPSPALPPEAVRAIATYAQRFAEETLHGGRGLYLLATEDTVLSSASQYVAQLFAAANVPTCALRAHVKPRASEARSALAAPLLLVERIDFACPPIVDLVSRRAELLRPTIVTSCVPPDALADVYLRRVLLALTRVLTVAEPETVHAPHLTPAPADV